MQQSTLLSSFTARSKGGRRRYPCSEGAACAKSLRLGLMISGSGQVPPVFLKKTPWSRAEASDRRNTQTRRRLLMKAAHWHGCLPVLAATLLLIYGTPAKAQNLALGKPVIDQSSRWNGQNQ